VFSGYYVSESLVFGSAHCNLGGLCALTADIYARSECSGINAHSLQIEIFDGECRCVSLNIADCIIVAVGDADIVEEEVEAAAAVSVEADGNLLLACLGMEGHYALRPAAVGIMLHESAAVNRGEFAAVDRSLDFHVVVET